jgi:phosphoribosylaminoimidazolecarboxamide formyltransferase / IMP cyclohydrolase
MNEHVAAPRGAAQAANRQAGVAVCVSGAGSNLRALHRAQVRGALGARIVLVLSDRPCPALEFAAANGIATALVEPASYAEAGAWDRAVADRLAAGGASIVVLAGFMRIVGPAVLAAFPGRIINLHPAILPSFRGAHGARDALRAGVRVTGVTVHLVTDELDAGPIVLQEAVTVLDDDDEASLLERLQAVEHRVLPRAVALLVAGALSVADGRVHIDGTRAAALPVARRALLSVSDKAGLAELGQGLSELGFELVSTGGTARALRAAGLDVTDVSSVTGFPEMLDGRVKTLHPRVAAGILADLRRDEHRAQLSLAGIEPFELVVVNLYPFEAAARRPGISVDDLIEEIDIGGPSLVRAAAKNHASVAIVTDPRTYGAILGELRAAGRLCNETRRRLAAEAFRHTAAYDALIASVLPARLGLATVAQGGASQGAMGMPVAAAGPQGPLGPGRPVVAERLPERLELRLERVQQLRYGENPHQAAALYRVPGASAEVGPFALGVDLRQGKPLSYNNILDAAAAVALARDLRGPACAIIKHTNPCGAAEAADLATAWKRALEGDPVSAFGGVVALTRPIDAAMARRLTSMFLEVVAAPGVESDAAEILAAKPGLRVVVDPSLDRPPAESSIEFRSAGGGILATESDVCFDDPSTWRLATTRESSDRERSDLDLAWRVARHVKSNAIVLVRDGALAGIGAGQMSRVDSARLAVGKAGAARCRGAACASDAYYPFPDAVEVCTTAGVTTFAQPGGSIRDAEVIAAAESAGVTMYLTGVRHFRH